MPIRSGSKESSRNICRRVGIGLPLFIGFSTTFFPTGRTALANLLGDTDDNTQGAPQAYRVLARKYRPSSFAELIGQEAMVRTLTNAIQAGRLPQAWILTGVRGIGKTTTARIIAKALNCTDLKCVDGRMEPCNVCDACRAIADDRHVDVQEMDAASRTGVDDIREIVDGVRYGPVSAKYKIYILDEVHMLSKNAFNALLKTLEEPPPHAKFIFATTEIRKVPVTVLSRCQRFDLRRISVAQLTEHFLRICEKEQAKADPEAVKLIAIAADGSVRDGLSLLDQAIARGDGSVGLEDVKDMLGLADRAASLSLCRQLLRGEMADALETFDGMLKVGCDPLQALQDLADLIHHLTRAQIVPEGREQAELPEGERGLMTDLADIKIPALTRAWQILLKGIGETQSAPNAAAAAEMVLIRLAYAAELPLPGDLIKQLREQKASLAATAPTGNGGGGNGGGASMRASGALASGAARVLQSTPAAAPQVQATTALNASPMPHDFEALVALFAEKREGALYAELCNYAHLVRLTAGRLEIRLDPSATPSLLGRVTQCLTGWTGQRWMVALSDEAGEPTLTEKKHEIERLRHERAEAHPLMLAVRQTFPAAKLVSLKQKELAPLPSGDDDAADEETLSEDE